MNNIFEIFLLFGVGIITGFINVMAGGGSTITLPVLIFLGLDSSLANGTNRIGLLFQNLSGILSFKNENVSQLKLSVKLSLFTLPGAVLGALYATKIDDILFQKILIYLLLLTLLQSLMYFPLQLLLLALKYLLIIHLLF